MVQEKSTKTPFKGDNVNTLLKMSNCEIWSFISLRQFRKLQHLLCFFGFHWPNNCLKVFLASPSDQKYPRYPLALKFNVTLARPLRFVIPYLFKWKFLSDVRHLYLHDSKWNLRFDVDRLTHTKQLLNLLCIVYIPKYCWMQTSFASMMSSWAGFFRKHFSLNCTTKLDDVICCVWI